MPDYRYLKRKVLAMPDKIAMTYLDLNLVTNNNKKQILQLLTPKKTISTLSYSVQENYL